MQSGPQTSNEDEELLRELAQLEEQVLREQKQKEKIPLSLLAEDKEINLQRKELASRVLEEEEAPIKIMVAKEMVGSTVEPNTLDQKKPSWKPVFTFSWERESSDVHKTQQDLNILAFYQPAGMTDEDWWEVIRGKNTATDFKHWERLLESEQEWLWMLRRCDMAAGYKFMIEQSLGWTDLRRSKRAPGYLREKLLIESGGKLWETTLAWAVPELTTVVGQIRALERVLGNEVLVINWPDTARPSCHIHMAFRRAAGMSFKQRVLWGRNMAGFAALLNDYAALKLYENAIEHPFLGPFTEYNLRLLEVILSQRRITRGSETSTPPLGAVETTHGGSNYGPFKYGATSFRTVYKARQEDEDFDLELVGFEFRSWDWLKDLIPHVATVQKVLSTTRFYEEKERIELGGAGRAYTTAELCRFQHTGAEVLAELQSLQPRAIEFILMAIVRYKERSKLTRLQDHELLLRCLYPFLKWHEHPAVPGSEVSRIETERNKLIKAILNFCTMAELSEEKIKRIRKKEIQDLASLTQTDPWKALHQRIRLWAARTQIWKFF